MTRKRTHWWWRFLAWCSEADRYPHVPWGKDWGRN